MSIVQQAYQVAQELDTRLEEYRTTKARTPSKWVFFITLGFSACAFLFGVVFPIFDLNISPLFWKFIPVSVYFWFFALVAIKVWSI
jgi:hypothetical protein